MKESEMNDPTFAIDIRQSKISDVDAINELEKQVFSSKMRYGPSLIMAIINTSLPHLAQTAILKDQNTIVGFIAGEIDSRNPLLGRIITIEVDPKLQHHKIGKQLLLSFERKISDHYSVENLELQVHYENHKAIRFYKKHGFSEVKKLKNYYARKEHAILMHKLLS